MIEKHNDNTKKLETKKASEMLLKGGKLISEPCKKCNGLQIEFQNRKTCVNCGSIESDHAENKDIFNENVQNNRVYPYASNLTNKLKNRIEKLLIEVGADKTLVEEEQRIRVIEGYVRLLEKIQSNHIEH